jgi:hypothetical protein
MKARSRGRGRTVGVGFESGQLLSMINEKTFEAGTDNDELQSERSELHC